MKILILAAGYGTRLYPLIVDTPKALLPIAQKPLVTHTLEKLKEIRDIKEIIAVTNDKFYPHFTDWAQQNKDFPAPIAVVNDGTTTPENRLGSVGDIDFVLRNYPVQDDLLIVGGDNVFDFDLKTYVAFALAHKPSVTIGLYDIGQKQDATQFGVVEISDDQKIFSFEEKPAHPKSSLIAMCFYFLPQNTLEFISHYIEESEKTDKAGDYIRWLVKNKEVYGFRFQGKWYDIGSIESYHEAEREFLIKKGPKSRSS